MAVTETTSGAGPRPQHRDHGPHRCGQDDDDGADPLLHGPHPQAGRGARGRRDDGLDGAGAGARHHDHVGRHDGVLARPSHQHHRYARARGLYRRGGAQPARARRRRRRLRLGRRRPAAVRDRLAAGRQVQGPADRVHQQDGPHRRELLRRRAVDARPPGREPRADPDPDRPGGPVPRRRRPRRDEGDRLQGRPRAGVRRHRHPGRARRAGRRVPPPADRRDLALRRRGADRVPRGRDLGQRRR